MCGLFFVVERTRVVNRQRAFEATQALRHRGPDGIGEYSFTVECNASEGPFAVSGFVGHTRLSILDPSTRSSQPFRRGKRTLAYNGEIYNFRELRGELARAGASFQTDGDTEVLLELVASAVAALVFNRRI